MDRYAFDMAHSLSGNRLLPADGIKAYWQDSGDGCGSNPMWPLDTRRIDGQSVTFLEPRRHKSEAKFFYTQLQV